MSQSLNNVELSLKERLTVLLVTSPIVSHPSTELLDKVVSSFQLVTDLNSCKLIILADGVKCGKFRPKRGSVTSEMLSNYSSYLDKIDEKIRSADENSLWSRTSLVRMTEHLGFGHVVYHGLRMCQTEYVMVVQHDHPFSFSFSISPVISFLDSGQAVYVTLPISTVWRHVNRAASLYQMDLRRKTVQFQDAQFVPILFWYDGTHIVRTKTYKELVFEGEQSLPLGHFIEDTFSQWVMKLLREDYEKWHKIFSMFAYKPRQEEEALIYHLDGRKYRTDEERKLLGWVDNVDQVKG